MAIYDICKEIAVLNGGDIGKKSHVFDSLKFRSIPLHITSLIVIKRFLIYPNTTEHLRLLVSQKKYSVSHNPLATKQAKSIHLPVNVEGEVI